MYEVFLSFKGEDTRKSFTGHLYAALNRKGIYTSMDDEELERGKSISPELLKAIDESILLVFYDVEPTHVRKHGGDFEKAFAKHEQVLKDGGERIKKWREAFAQFVDYTGGLPLALTVFGSFVFRRSLTEWCSELDRLKKNPGEQLLHMLRVGFGGLASTDEKDIFLDIACFFKGESVKCVKRIFESYDYYPDIRIRILLEKSLLNDFWRKVVDASLLQEMGKDIVRKQSQQELGKRSRLWLHEDAVEVLSKNEPLEKLVIMDLSDCEYLTKTLNFTEIPKLESLPHKISLRSLKTFILSGCYKLKRFPEIDETMKQLSKLHLDETAIIELPTSIKYLTGLILLNLKDGKSLLSLPSVIGILTSLQILNISGCSKLEELPKRFGSLESLVELDASRSGIRQVPSFIVILKNLKVLSLAQCGGLPHNPWGWLFSCCLLPSEVHQFAASYFILRLMLFEETRSKLLQSF
ncbi:PREDICTED: TMV resistance protein N-like [Prunus mume]|uniref:TMV resistance protein N-like n=1 Tax=Prunus mume TaxID=102107 RepID=A0ABM0NCF7_PRUMU|nr:PREDICTED: TMV resistance protein N-like [Prunus mume]